MAGRDSDRLECSQQEGLTDENENVSSGDLCLGP
jgi:hypothetical protein